MSKTISRTVSLTVTPTPEEMAHIFWSMDDLDQSRFFHALYVEGFVELGKAFEVQMLAAAKEGTKSGREVMRIIGECSDYKPAKEQEGGE